MSVLDSFSLAGRVAVVTGASGGLGAAAACALAEAGAHVVLTGRSTEALSLIAKDINGSHPSYASTATFDVGDADSVPEAFAKLRATHGHLDVLVNNAGMTHDSAPWDVSTKDWDRVIDVNLRSAFVCTREFVGRPDEQVGSALPRRSVINVASLASAVGVRGQTAYTASKAGLIGLTRTLALDLAGVNVRVNALAPGYFRTEMPRELLADPAATERLLRKVPQRRVPEPVEIGPPMVFLASGASEFMTGATLHFDGGYTAL